MSLLDEIKSKCSAALIASRNEDAIAIIVNSGRTKVVPVPISQIQQYLMTVGKWWSIKSAVSTNQAAFAAVDLVESRLSSMDVTLPVTLTMLAALVTSGLISQSDSDAIVAMGTVPNLVTSYDVAHALEGY